MSAGLRGPELWLDAHLSRKLAPWIRGELGFACRHISDVGHRGATDDEFYRLARSAGAVIISKDEDLPAMVKRLGPPPRVIWLTCGNSSNSVLKRLLAAHLADVMRMLESGEDVVQLDLPAEWPRR